MAKTKGYAAQVANGKLDRGNLSDVKLALMTFRSTSSSLAFATLTFTKLRKSGAKQSFLWCQAMKLLAQL